jgi:hypothetical protein
MALQALSNRGSCPTSQRRSMSACQWATCSRNAALGPRYRMTLRVHRRLRRAPGDAIVSQAVQDTPTAVEAVAFPRGQWSLHKFGGTCVSTAERIAQAGEVLVKVFAASHSRINMSFCCENTALTAFDSSKSQVKTFCPHMPIFDLIQLVRT